MLLHGWPGSAFEFIQGEDPYSALCRRTVGLSCPSRTAIKILRESTSPAFHLIVPMEPGYGWSSPPPLDRGFTMDDCAELLNQLMVGLGYGEGYAVQVGDELQHPDGRRHSMLTAPTRQGGDIGSGLARLLAVKYDACKCININ